MISVFEVITIILLIYIVYKYYMIRKIYKDKTNSELSGCEIGNKILENNNLDNIYIVKTSNPFEEGFDIDRKIIKLSKEVFDGENLVYSILIARECSYSILDKDNNRVLKFKYLLSNIINILVCLCYLSIIICSIIKNFYFLRIGIILLIVLILYHFIFINLEEKCNSLAIKQLQNINIINDDNVDKAKKIFNVVKYSYITNPINLIYKIIIYFIKK